MLSKIFLFARDPNHIHILPVSSLNEGRIAIVTDVGWDAVDAAASARNEIAGRASARERLTARRRTALKRTAKPCGPGTRCWCQVGGGFASPTGFGNTFNPLTTVTRRIRRRGEHDISR
jgi:hypothetical protein